MSDGNLSDEEADGRTVPQPKEQPSLEDQMDVILNDPNLKAALLLKMGLGDSDGNKTSGKPNANREDGHLTPSGKSTGGWPAYPPFWPPYPYPPAPFPGYPPFTSQGTADARQSRGTGSRPLRDEPGPSGLATSGGMTVTDDDEDAIELLDEAEALELVEFDPCVEPKDSWQAPTSITSFLDKHFNKALSEEERSAIMKDFPKPVCKVLSAPKLDEQVKDQLKKKGKDPHFGSEKSLFKLQEQLLDVAGPLTCLWADLLNKEATVTAEDTLLLVQRALVLLGSASHNITVERRKIAWSRINPKLKSLATEDYNGREANLFGSGFLEKASKRLEVEKTLAKVSNQGKGGQPPSKKARYENDKGDLRSFLSKGTSVSCRNAKNMRQNQPHTSYTRFKSRRYFQSSSTAKPAQGHTGRSESTNQKSK